MEISLKNTNILIFSVPVKIGEYLRHHNDKFSPAHGAFRFDPLERFPPFGRK